MDQTFLDQKSLKTLGIIVLVLLFVWGLFSVTSVVKPNSDTYQAVFLNNGQVYFGKLTANRSQYILQDVFYIQSFDPKKTNQEIKLVKFGDELYGPEDKMVLEKSQVTLWENLKPESKVLQGIIKFKTEGPTIRTPEPVAQPVTEPESPKTSKTSRRR